MLSYDRSNFMQKNVFDEQTDWYQISEDVWQDEGKRLQAINKILMRNEEIDNINNTFRIQYENGGWKQIKEEFDEDKYRQEAKSFIFQSSVGNDMENNSNLKDQEKEIYQSLKSEFNKNQKQIT